MHTSSLFQATDFRYQRVDHSGSDPAEFVDLFPEYHELDRVGIVSLRAEDGIRHAGGALLALTTAFYDALRSRGTAFFNYPQHFALLGLAAAGSAPPDLATVGHAWGYLDVWPESNWIAAPPTATGMLRKALDLQVNRLFWPEALHPDGSGEPLPPYARALLESRLKSVLLYATASPTVAIRAPVAAARIIERSLARLPAAAGQPPAPATAAIEDEYLWTETFRPIAVPDFLAAMATCFAPPATGST